MNQTKLLLFNSFHINFALFECFHNVYTLSAQLCLCFHVRLEDGRLLDYLVAHDELMEEKVAFFIRETLEALEHLHTCRVAHLDLKVTAGFCHM